MMRMRIAGVLIAALAMLGSTAAAAGTPVIVSGPGSYLVNYTQPVIVASVGDIVAYVNLDVQRHDVVADGVYRPTDSAEWCVLFGADECPLFWTPLIGLGQQTEVRGLEDVESGTTYDFLCTIHQNMWGLLVVV